MMPVNPWREMNLRRHTASLTASVEPVVSTFERNLAIRTLPALCIDLTTVQAPLPFLAQKEELTLHEMDQLQAIVEQQKDINQTTASNDSSNETTSTQQARSTACVVPDRIYSLARTSHRIHSKSNRCCASQHDAHRCCASQHDAYRCCASQHDAHRCCASQHDAHRCCASQHDAHRCWWSRQWPDDAGQCEHEYYTDTSVSSMDRHSPPQQQRALSRLEQLHIHFGETGCIVVDTVCRLGKLFPRLADFSKRVHEAGGFIIVLLSPSGVVIDTRTRTGRAMFTSEVVRVCQTASMVSQCHELHMHETRAGNSTMRSVFPASNVRQLQRAYPTSA
jgi:hypothetical protein